MQRILFSVNFPVTKTATEISEIISKNIIILILKLMNDEVLLYLFYILSHCHLIFKGGNCYYDTFYSVLLGYANILLSPLECNLVMNDFLDCNSLLVEFVLEAG